MLYTSVLCEHQHLQMQIQSIYHGKAVHGQQTQIYDLRYCAVALAKVTDWKLKPGTVVRDLGVWFEAELSMRLHVSRVAHICFYNLRRIRAVRLQLAATLQQDYNSYSTCPVASALLQRRAGRSSSFHTSTVPASPARSGMHRSGSQAAWPCDSSSSSVALVASRWEDPVQAVCWFTSRFWDPRRNI